MKIKFSNVKDHNFKYQIPLKKTIVYISQSPAEIINMYYNFLINRCMYYFMTYEEDVSEIHKYNKDFTIKIEGAGEYVFLCVKIKGRNQKIYEYSFKNHPEGVEFDVPVFLF